ncbi:MAG: hypothetical protein JW790_04720 [Dehalococcoidales bacterium]|jgi:hypothetical protein|nr:hypothetical protein [Dehalococcoidales bacterium]
MNVSRNMASWLWWPIVITVIALVGVVNQWPISALAPILIAILVSGLVVAVTSSKRQRLELSLSRLRQMAGYFTRRFMGDSSLSIFAIIDTLFTVENPKLWDWARACDMAKRVFNTWCDSFINRIESDVRSGRPQAYLYIYLNELWLVNNHYYEFIEQFCEIAGKVELPQETKDQYGRMVMEYNAFAQEFRDTISDLRKITRTEIEPPSIRFAQEIAS